MGSGMFDGLVRGLLFIGTVIGLFLAGVVYGLIWLFSHMHITWVWK